MVHKMPHAKTLFHLVPTNDVAHSALLHPDNTRFVSSSRTGPLGLEIGHHVSSTPRGHVITRLGRNADLTLCKSSPGMPMSGIHVAFEINPATGLVLLSVRSKNTRSVTSATIPRRPEKHQTHRVPGQDNAPDTEDAEQHIAGQQITGDGVILYDWDYEISIASYNFELIWLNDVIQARHALAAKEHEESLKRLKDVRSRDQPTEIDHSEALSWHVTRLNTARKSVFNDIPHLRNKKGDGSYGKAYQAIDQTSGNEFAIKVIELKKFKSIENARALLHREIKLMERLNHVNIIQLLGYQNFHSLLPEIFMPLREGSLTDLFKPLQKFDSPQLCLNVLEQMLSALDYLGEQNIVHRDIKPDNILYYTLPNNAGYRFQLADFGLAHYFSLARTMCGTGFYQAPELWPQVSMVSFPQSPKMDVWSLFATIVAIDCGFSDFPPPTNNYRLILGALEAKGKNSILEPMVRRDPTRRASAAQMLVRQFNGRGLTTPLSKIPPIEPLEDNPPLARPLQAVDSSLPSKAKNNGDKADARPVDGITPVAVNRTAPRQQPPRASKNRITKR